MDAMHETGTMTQEPSGPRDHGSSPPSHGIVGRSAAFQRTLRLVESVAATDAAVLIRGETGTGKELIAGLIHELSGRKRGPLVKFNCTAIPAGLLESELVGHERGAFTGAVGRRVGRFELAHKGTLLLDEVGDLPLDLQLKLLRVLEEQEFERLGSTHTIRSVRVIAATNRPLEQLVEAGEFRADLYYRLNVFPIDVPPLRERTEDIPLLARQFVARHAAKLGRRIASIAPEVMETLTRYPWPGNVRELQHVLHRAVILSSGDSLQLPPLERGIKTARPAAASVTNFDDAVREQILAEDSSIPGIGVDGADRRELVAVADSLPTDVSGLYGPLWLRSSRERLLANGEALCGITGAETLTCGLGDYRRALPIWRDEALRAESQGHLRDLVRCWAGIARCQNALGEFVEARRAYQRGVEYATRLAGLGALTMALIATRTEMCLAIDDEWEALRVDPEAQRPDGPGREVYWSAVSVRAATALTAARHGKSERALGFLDTIADALNRAPGGVESYTFAACAAAEAAWLLGSVTHAQALERNIRTKVVGPDFRWPMMDGRLGLARLCALRQHLDEAGEWFAQARVVFEEQGARPLRAIADFDEALMWRRRRDPGERRRANSLLEAARLKFSALGMTGWIRRTEALIRDVGVRPTTRVPTPPVPSFECSPDETVFCSRGDYWTISFEGQTIQLRGTRGLRYLAQLLHHPGREFHAIDLVVASRSALPRAADPSAVIRFGLGDAGVLLDGKARNEYRGRLTELREDLDDAERMNDLGRIARARDEIDAITHQLTTAARGRTAASHAERARVTVTKGIKSALDRIASSHPSLARHLTATIRRGYFCVYLPDSRYPIVWQV